MSPKHVLAGSAAVLALVIAGCGGSSSGGYGGGQSQPSTPAGAGGASVGVANSNLGKILVDAKGRTLYLFEADTGPKSTCAGACASAWPPLTTDGKPAAVDGATAAMLGTTKRPDGTTEVTYAGHPLYRYAGDTSPGQATGENLDQFGAEWYVVSPAGAKVEPAG